MLFPVACPWSSQVATRAGGPAQEPYNVRSSQEVERSKERSKRGTIKEFRPRFCSLVFAPPRGFQGTIKELRPSFLLLRPAAPAFGGVLPGAPVGFVVGKDRETDHLPIIPGEDAVVVDVQAQGQVGIARGLHLNVDQQPLLDAVARPDLQELIDPAPPLEKSTG